MLLPIAVRLAWNKMRRNATPSTDSAFTSIQSLKQGSDCSLITTEYLHCVLAGHSVFCGLRYFLPPRRRRR